MIIKQNFFNIVRQEFGKLNQSQVEGFDFILDSLAEQEEIKDLRQFAYILATIWHETAATMQPIEEFGKGKGRPYGVADPVTKQVYYGRGYVQITWKTNYQKFANLLNVNLILRPELALDKNISIKICLIGMKEGFFRPSHTLGVYFNDRNTDWINARKIINGARQGEKLPDKAKEIAEYAQKFYKALQ